MTVRKALVLVSMFLGVLGACDDDDGAGGDRDAEAPGPDGGDVIPDGGGMDAGPEDGGVREDAAEPMDAGGDAGFPDAGGTDAGDAAIADAAVGDATVPDAAVGTTFTRVYEIITAHCGPCHTENATPSASLDMRSQATAYTELVDAAAQGGSCSGAGLVRVVPGDPEASLLIHKLEGMDDDSNPVCGSRMPFGRAALDQALIDEIADWIEAGALND